MSARDLAMFVIGLLLLIFAALIGFADRNLFGTLAILPIMTICTAAARGYETRQMGRFAGCGMALVASGVLVALRALHPVAGDAFAVFMAVIFGGVALKRSMWLGAALSPPWSEKYKGDEEGVAETLHRRD